MRFVGTIAAVALSAFLVVSPAKACSLVSLSVVNDEGETSTVQLPASPIQHLLRQHEFSGAFAIARDDRPIFAGTTPDMVCGRHYWPYASVTKQIAAVIIMRLVERGELKLDYPISAYLPDWFGGLRSPTIRQLLRHQSGLRNPERTTPDKNDVPSFYSTGPTGYEWCFEGRSEPATEGYTYNNCDYIVLGELLRRVTGENYRNLLRDEILEPAGLLNNRSRISTVNWYPTHWFRQGRGTLAKAGIDPARYGMAGGLFGNLTDLVRFDRALMNGKLLGPETLAEMWRGDSRLGHMALGQWSFHATLKGCAAPVWVIERRGVIGRFQIRNFILPDREIAAVMATEIGEDEFSFGELWRGEGLSYEFLSLLACETQV